MSIRQSAAHNSPVYAAGLRHAFNDHPVQNRAESQNPRIQESRGRFLAGTFAESKNPRIQVPILQSRSGYGARVRIDGDCDSGAAFTPRSTRYAAKQNTAQAPLNAPCQAESRIQNLPDSESQKAILAAAFSLQSAESSDASLATGFT